MGLICNGIEVLQYRSCGIFAAWDRSVCIAVTRAWVVCLMLLGRMMLLVWGKEYELVILAKQQQHPSWSLLGSSGSVRCRDPILIGLLTCLLTLVLIKSCHLGSQWPWVLTRVMIFADYWLEPIMIIRAREHGNEVTARLRSQISPHHPVPTTQQLQQHFKNWSAC